MDDFLNPVGFVYRCIAPNDKAYVGKTTDKNKRLKAYKYNHFKYQVKLWNSCKKYNWNPADTFEVIEECEASMLSEREIYWIAKLDSFNNGLNCTIGGEGSTGFKHSKETIEKLRFISSNKTHSEETKKKISKAASGEKNSFYGRNHSESTKKKMSEIKKGKKQSQELINKRVAKVTGRKNSEETIEKMRKAHNGKTISDEQKQKLSQIHSGKPWSEARRKAHELKQKTKIEEN